MEEDEARQPNAREPLRFKSRISGLTIQEP